MYSLEEIKQKLQDAGIENHLLSGTNNMLQLGEQNTTVHVARNGFIFYATKEDFDAICNYNWQDNRLALYGVRGKSKSECDSIIESERVAENHVVCLEYGNTSMNSSAPAYQPHRVYVFKDENVDSVLKILALQRGLVSNKRFEVNAAVWVAAAVMSYEKYHSGARKIEEYSFIQADICRRAEEFAIGAVANPRVHQHNCGDHKDHTNCYLRETPGKGRRLTIPGEFNGIKEEPERLDASVILNTKVGNISVKDLLKFVHTEYAAMANQADIDYIGVLVYLENNQEIPYVGPDKVTNDVDREKYNAIKERGQWVVGELKKMAESCQDKYKLDKCLPISWLDGSNTKTRKYLWAQMKYNAYADNPISISIFVENNGDEGARYRISLEIKNDGTSANVLKQYHSFLEMPIDEDSGLVCVYGSNQWGNPQLLTESQEEIKERIDAGEIRKVQLCRYIERTDGESNEYYHRELLKSVKLLLPYYEHVLGIEKPVYWPSKEEYDPGLSAEDWIEILSDSETILPEPLLMLAKMVELGGEATCAKLAEEYGGKAANYNNYGQDIGRRVHNNYDVPLCDDEGSERYFPIPFVGRNVVEDGNKRYSWKIRDELMEALESIELPKPERGRKIAMKEFGLNTILYGPPGTGKTYNTVKYAVEICDPEYAQDHTEYDELLDRFNELKEDGRIAFTTFHQSYGYEEFIEGIKPCMDNDDTEDKNVSYKIEDGLFKAFCDKARQVTISTDNESVVKTNPRIWCLMLDGTGESKLKIYCFENNEIRTGWTELPEKVTSDMEDVTSQTKSMVLYFQDEMEIGDIVITQKFRDSIDGLGIITGDYEYDTETFDGAWPRKRSVKWLAKDVDIDIYDINGGKHLSRPTLYPMDRIKADELLSLVVADEDSDVTVEKKSLPHVFIIDEINRGNISKIFGELITLIEVTKRDGAEEAMETILPYSGKRFSVPNNVYILGTMNTADRSIAIMDTALRRRFDFKEMMPDVNVLSGINVTANGKTVNVSNMLRKINERIEYLFDREHTIGHAFFVKLRKDPSVKCLAGIFRTNVVPLLQEYFYEDYEKIQLVLGDNSKSDPAYKFILDEDLRQNEVFKGNPEIDLPDKKYKIQDSAFDKIESYSEII